MGGKHLRQHRRTWPRQHADNAAGDKHHQRAQRGRGAVSLQQVEQRKREQQQQDAGRDHHAAAADFIAEPAGRQNGGRKAQVRNHRAQQRLIEAGVQRRLQIAGHNHQPGIARRRPEHHPRNRQQDNFQRLRGARLRTGLLVLANKARRLLHAQPQPQRNQPERQRQQERHAPAPGQHRIAAEQPRKQRHDPRSRQQAQRHGKRLPCAVEPALARRRKFGHQRHRAAILAAREQPLQNTQSGEDQRRGDAQRGAGRRQANQRGRQRHQQQHRDQRWFTADPVTDAAEDNRAQRTKEKGDGEGGVGQDQAAERRCGVQLKKILRDERREKAVNGKLIPFDKVADRTGYQRASLTLRQQLRIFHRRILVTDLLMGQV